jgi:serine/threonine-protein kinase HipA
VKPFAQAKSPARLYLWYLANPATPKWVGELTPLGSGDCALRYAPQWLDTGFPLSLDIPLVDTLHAPIHHHLRNSGAPGAVDDARPDRWGEKVIRYLYKKGASVYDNLYFAGDERFGSLGTSSSSLEYIPFQKTAMPRLQDAQILSEAARIIESGEGELAQQQRDLVRAGGSLGGAKPKAVIRIEGEDWVIKFANGEHFDLPLVEYATMRLARKAGLNVAEVRPVRLAGETALAIKRFDRSQGQRAHCISACTLLRSLTPQGEDPEFGYPHLARALRQYGNTRTLQAQLRELFGRMVFNILMANRDDHEKNHSLLCIVDGRTMTLELSPGYDILPSDSGATEHQIFISNDSRDPSLKEAISVHADFGLTRVQAATEVQRLIAVVNGWQDFFKEIGVTDADIDEISTFIDAPELLDQRTGFDPSQYPEQTARARQRKAGAAAFRRGNPDS